MKTLKIGLVLLALLLVGMLMLPMVSAEYHADLSVNSGNRDISVNYPHQIPDDYLNDSKPAEWLPESEMINIILSQKTLERFGYGSNSDIIEVPLIYLESKSNFVTTEKFPGYKVEDGISPDEKIVLIRMPRQLYDTFIKEDADGKLSLPSTYFCRFYWNFDDLSSHITKDDKGVAKITPSSHYPVRGSLDDDNPTNAQESSLTKASSSSLVSGIEKTGATLSVPQSYFHWVRAWRLNSATNYKYSIGQLRPESRSVSGMDFFKIFQEREYKFDNGDCLEVIVQYFDRNEYAGIILYPALYRNGAQSPLPTNQWYHWGGQVVIDPNDLPHMYGYHVQIGWSGTGYQVDFEDMETLNWIAYYTVSATSTVSSFTELDGSNEYNQVNVPSTGTFSATTNPFIEEWVFNMSGGVFDKPYYVWQTPIPYPTTPPPYVSVLSSWDCYGNLLTRSYAHYP